jgi:hypothetical protein
MKIITLTHCDFGGSARQMADAINKHTDHTEIIIAAQRNWAKTKVDYCLDDISRSKIRSYSRRYHRRQEIQSLINKADIIKFKGDEVPNRLWCGFVIPKDKPMIVSVGGSNFRRHKTPVAKVCLAKSPINMYFIADVRTALTADLNYPEFQGIYTPQAIDSKSKPNAWQLPQDKIIIAHSPSNRLKKGTDDYFLPAVKILQDKGYNIDVDLIENVPLAQCIERKKNSHLFIDQCVTGFFGNAALEAMQYGIPVACWLPDFAVKQSGSWLNNCPVINVEPNVEKFAASLETVLDPLKLQKLSLLTKAYCDLTHSHQVVAGNWDKLYKGLINGRKVS